MKSNECVEFGNPEYTDSQSKYEISRPGRYCLTEDLHARIDFADHPSEATLIDIRSDHVVLDLQGHILGRGRLFKNRGGVGISIGPRLDLNTLQDKTVSNITIRNGTLQDFKYGIYRYSGYRYRTEPINEIPVYEASTDTYRFPRTGVVVEKVKFKNNEHDFTIQFHDASPAP